MNLAANLNKLGDYQGSRDFYLKSLEIVKKNFG